MNTKQLRQKILDLAIHGKLVPQDPNDEPASVLLEKIRAEKERLIKEGKIKRNNKSKISADKINYENVPFEVPIGWVWTSFNEILTLISGQDFEPEKYNDKGIGVPYIIGASNIKDENLIVNRWTNCPSVYSYLNDLLVVCKGTVGKVAINNIGEIHIARQIQAIRAYSKKINIHYIKAVVQSNIENIISNANGLIPGLKREIFLSLQIPLPPLSEQQRIVTEIERWFALIDKIEKSKNNIQNYISQAKTKILNLAIHGKLVPQDPNDEPAIELLKRINPKFTPCDKGQYPNGWTLCSLGMLVEIISGVSYKKEDVKSKGIKIIRGGNIQNGKIIECDDDVYIDMKYKCDFNNIKKGDIVLVASTGSNILIGKNAYSKKDWNKTQIGAFLRIIRCKDLNISYYLNYILHSDYYNNYIRSLAKGTNINNIKNTHLEKFPIPVPPLSEQQRIVKKIEGIFGTLDKIQESLDA